MLAVVKRKKNSLIRATRNMTLMRADRSTTIIDMYLVRVPHQIPQFANDSSVKQL